MHRHSALAGRTTALAVASTALSSVSTFCYYIATGQRVVKRQIDRQLRRRTCNSQRGGPEKFRQSRCTDQDKWHNLHLASLLAPVWSVVLLRLGTWRRWTVVVACTRVVRTTVARMRSSHPRSGSKTLLASSAVDVAESALVPWSTLERVPSLHRDVARPRRSVAAVAIGRWGSSVVGSVDELRRGRAAMIEWRRRTATVAAVRSGGSTSIAGVERGGGRSSVAHHRVRERHNPVPPFKRPAVDVTGTSLVHHRRAASVDVVLIASAERRRAPAITQERVTSDVKRRRSSTVVHRRRSSTSVHRGRPASIDARRSAIRHERRRWTSIVLKRRRPTASVDGRRRSATIIERWRASAVVKKRRAPVVDEGQSSPVVVWLGWSATVVERQRRSASVVEKHVALTIVRN